MKVSFVWKSKQPTIATSNVTVVSRNAEYN